MSLDWKGDALLRKTEKAQALGINQTMADAVEHAKRNHAWQTRTKKLQGSIQVAEKARRHGSGFRGKWGSKGVVYALIHELGGTIVPKNAKALVFQIGGETIFAKKVKIPARPYLRPAADATYGGLAGNIKRALAKL